MILKYLFLFSLVACFNFKYSKVSGQSQCSGKVKVNYSGQSIISSIGNYTENSRCSWLIETSKPNSIILLHIEYFETEANYDPLYVYHGDSVDAPLYATLSGRLPNHKEIKILPKFSGLNKAFLYFSSDTNTNFAGFNISYYYDDCTLGGRFNSLVCSKPKRCPNNCFNELGQGECLKGSKCHCSNGYVGENCGQKVTEGVWKVFPTKDFILGEPRASVGHCAYIWKDQQYIIGGMSYQNEDFVKVIKFIFPNLVWPSLPGKGEHLLPRYGHSCVHVGSKVYLYGGKFMNSTETNELWTYDMINSFYVKWHRVRPSIRCSKDKMCAPIKVSGHTANLIKGPNGEDKMLVIFGYSSKYGYLNTVQEYDLKTGEWQIVNTTGFPVKGSYGHTSVYDKSSNIVYIFGGLAEATNPSKQLTNRLYAYHTLRKEWKLAAPAPFAPRYLHSAILVSKGMMLVFGGKTSNEYQPPETIVYDLTCDSWQRYQMPESIDTCRFGHSAFMYNKSMYIYSGSDGHMISNMLRFTPGTCDQYNNSTECLRSQVGLKCLWIEDTRSCQALKDVDNHTNYLNCLEHIEQTTMRMKLCQQLTDCTSCTQTTNDCVWCKGECSHRKNCTRSKNVVHHSPEMCDNKFSPKESEVNIKVPNENCYEITSCKDCTESNTCVWCQNQQQCVNRHGYAAVFPYDQCRDYNIFKEQCPDEENTTNGEWCSVYTNCTKCGNDPACGWCEDLSGTGTGKCLHGGAGRSKNCPSGQWYFIGCPKCQCNGHSTCHPESGDCIEPCSDFTEGPHCERCQPGHWGDPENGGKCKACECSDHNYCDNKTGKCLACETIGYTGDFCERCNTKKGYVEGPLPGGCYYNLEPNYKFTFNLTRDGFEGPRKINFQNSALNNNIPVDFGIKCSMDARMDMTIEHEKGFEKFVLQNVTCSNSEFNKSFWINDYVNSSIDKSKKNTVYVHLHELRKPAIIEIYFVQNLSELINKA